MIFDEMAIVPRVDPDPSTGGFVGWSTLEGCEQELATKAFTVLLRCLGKDWKLYVMYHFTPSHGTSKATARESDKVLAQSFSVGLGVQGIVCDMGNRGMLTEIGFSTTKTRMIYFVPNPYSLDRPLRLIPDPVHVFKSMKEVLINRYVCLPSDIVELYNLPENVVDFEDVDWLNKYQNENCVQLKSVEI